MRRAGLALVALLSCLAGPWGILAAALYKLSPQARSLPEALADSLWQTHAPERTIGGGVDMLGTMWTYASVAQMLRGERGARAEGLYIPYGWDQGAHQGHAWADAALAWPWVELLGAPGFYNAALLSGVALTQLAAWLLFYRAGGGALLASALSLLLVWNPLLLREISEGRPTQAQLFFHCLFLLALLGLMLRRPRPLLPALLGGVGIAGALLTYWFSGFAVGLMGAAALTVRLLARGRGRAMLGGVGLSGLGLGLASAVAWPLVRRALEGDPSLKLLIGRLPLHHFDLGWFVVPVQTNPRLIEHPGELLPMWSRAGVEPALLAGALTATLLLPGRARRLPWLAGLLTVLTLPLGHAIVWKGQTWLTAFPFVQAAVPALGRCFQLERLGVAPLLGLLLLLALSAPPRLRLPAGLGMLALALARHPRPEQISAGGWNEPRAALWAARHAPGGIIDVPVWRSNTSYAAQIQHGQALLGGPGIDGIQRPQGHERWCSRNRLLADLERLAETGEGARSWREEDLSQLREAGLRTVLVHTDASRAPLSAYEELLGVSAWTEHRHEAVLVLPSP